MLYLIYLICSIPLVFYLESRPAYCFVGKALGTLNVLEKIFFYLMPFFKELYTFIGIIESKKPEWFDGI